MIVKPERYYSLDVFRGATVAFMIFVNNQQGVPYAPLDHAPWHGLTPTDLVFPFFLFAMGNAMSFVMPRFEKEGAAYAVRKIVYRSFLIFGIGLLLNWFPFLRWDHDRLVWKGWTWINDAGQPGGVRIMSVLGRIALCYLPAGLLIFFTGARWSLRISILLLLAYWAICVWLGSPGDPYSLQGFVGTKIDKYILGEPHMYHGEGVAFDPEGLLSTIAAITSVVAGFLAGRFIRRQPKDYETLAKLMIAGLLLLFAGYCWNMLFPVNKKIWTSSYAVASAGFAILCLAFFIYFIEFKGYKGAWSRGFTVFGMNPLFIFVLSGMIPRLTGLIRIPENVIGSGSMSYTTPLNWFYSHICIPLAPGDSRNASLLYALILVTFYWAVAYWLDRRKIYIKV